MYDTTVKWLWCKFLHLGNGIGDACEGDLDGDRVLDEDDLFPEDYRVAKTDFKTQHLEVHLSKSKSQPVWLLLDDVSQQVTFLRKTTAVNYMLIYCCYRELRLSRKYEVTQDSSFQRISFIQFVLLEQFMLMTPILTMVTLD